MENIKKMKIIKKKSYKIEFGNIKDKYSISFLQAPLPRDLLMNNEDTAVRKEFQDLAKHAHGALSRSNQPRIA
jgi:hypothetical protein